MQKLFFISIILLVSSASIEFGKETPFDTKTNHYFEFINQDKGFVFVYISCEKYNDSNLFGIISTTNGYTSYGSFKGPTQGILLYSATQKNYNIYLMKDNHMYGIDTFKDNEIASGTIWVNPSTNELPVDLSKRYERKIYVITAIFEDTQLPKLTYAINNAEKDCTFIFKYNETIDIEGEILSNPFEICQGNICSVNLTSYKFKKGESYKINLLTQRLLKDKHSIVLPAFSFADENYKESSGNWADENGTPDYDNKEDKLDKSKESDEENKSNETEESDKVAQAINEKEDNDLILNFKLWIISLLILLLF